VTQSIHLGYVVGTGEPVEIPLRHTAVTGQTQESGKTTTLEGLISRSGLQAVAYVTKRGESSFHVMHPIPPYFQERADWKFVQSLLEASTETKLKFEQSWIMRASEGAKTLQDVRRNISRFLDGVKAPPLPVAPPPPRKGRAQAAAVPKEPKERWIQKPARGLSGDVYYVLNKYLDDIMPQLAEMPYTTSLDLAAGLNVMDLRDYESPLQALVIRSVTDRIREHLDGTINIIPEAWKFAPKFRGSPVRLAAEEYVREAAAMKNFLWIDSQDLAGVADVLMRQVGVWLFGVQRATREIWRALEHMPEGLPAKRPRPADIATLSKGQFYVCFGREMHKVYVQPAWMTAAHAEAIARGEEDVESARDILKEYADEHKEAVASMGSKQRANHPAQRSGDDRLAHDAESESEHARSDANTSGSAGQASNIAAAQQKSSPREMSPAHESPRTDTDPGRDRQSAEPQSTSASTPARDARPVAPDDDPEETMWKEKYEAYIERLSVALGYPDPYRPPADELLGHVQSIRESAAGILGLSKQGMPAATNGAAVDVNGNIDFIYRYVRDRLSADLRTGKADAALLQLLREQPEIRVNVKRHTLEMSDDSTDGRIALLIAQKFFDTPQDSGTLNKEFKRRGWFDTKASNAALFKPLAKITEMGFLLREGTMYQAVPGIKINIVEA
jgi:hypothetical protein